MSDDEADHVVTAFGRYDLLALLSKSNVAEVWLARQRGMAGFEKLVVIKRLLARLSREPDYVDAFLDEARINSRLQHTNVLQTYDLGQVDGQYFFAMEYLEGLPLGVMAQRALSRLGDIPIAIAGGLVIQAANGVHYAHQVVTPDGEPLQIVHRDLSPQNLLVSWEGILKVADFASAKAEGRRARTKTGNVKGTPTYMSPEQVTGAPVDRRSDVFGLGIMLWELLTGRRLFKRDTPEQTYDAITQQAPPAPSTYRLELPASIDHITLRALARRPEDRYESAADLATELEAELHREGLRAEAMDVRSFLAKNFAPEHEAHERLLQRVRQGTYSTRQAPLFRHAAHGLDSNEELLVPTDEPFGDGDTERDLAELVVAADVPVAASQPPTELTPALPAKKTSSLRLVVVLVLLALAIALVVGALIGRRHVHAASLTVGKRHRTVGAPCRPDRSLAPS